MNDGGNTVILLGDILQDVTRTFKYEKSHATNMCYLQLVKIAQIVGTALRGDSNFSAAKRYQKTGLAPEMYGSKLLEKYPRRLAGVFEITREKHVRYCPLCYFRNICHFMYT